MGETRAEADVDQSLLVWRGVDAFHSPHHQRANRWMDAEEKIRRGAPLVQKMGQCTLVLGGHFDLVRHHARLQRVPLFPACRHRHVAAVHGVQIGAETEGPARERGSSRQFYFRLGAWEPHTSSARLVSCAYLLVFIDAHPTLHHLLVKIGRETLNRRKVGDRSGHTLLEFIHLGRECSLLVVEPVDNKWLIIQWHGRPERDVSHWIYRCSNEEAQSTHFGVGQGVAPDSTHIVSAVSQEDIGDAATERERREENFFL